MNDDLDLDDIEELPARKQRTALRAREDRETQQLLALGREMDRARKQPPEHVEPTAEETAAWLADIEANGGGRHNPRED